MARPRKTGNGTKQTKEAAKTKKPVKIKLKRAKGEEEGAGPPAETDPGAPLPEEPKPEGQDATPAKPEPAEPPAPPGVREQLRESIMSTLRISSSLPSYGMVTDYFEEKSVMRTAETVVLLCRRLGLSLPTLLTALVYLQLFKSASAAWRASKHFAAAAKAGRCRKFLKWDERYLTAAACVLLAWKYREDEIGLIKSTKKLFDLSVMLYKLMVSISPNRPPDVSVTSWMLQDSGEVGARARAGDQDAQIADRRAREPGAPRARLLHRARPAARQGWRARTRS